MRLAAIVVLAAPAVWADAFSWGIRGGVPFTDAFDAGTRGNIGFRNVPRRFTVGPAFEVHLPFKLGISFDILYKRLEYERAEAGVVRSTTASMFEFPILVRYRFGEGGVRPFLAAGPTFNKITGVAVRDPVEFVKSSAGGIAFGAGIELGTPLVRITPEIRVTHRGSENFRHPAGALLKSNLNQAEFLVGFTF